MSAAAATAAPIETTAVAPAPTMALSYAESFEFVSKRGTGTFDAGATAQKILDHPEAPEPSKAHARLVLQTVNTVGRRALLDFELSLEYTRRLVIQAIAYERGGILKVDPLMDGVYRRYFAHPILWTPDELISSGRLGPNAEELLQLKLKTLPKSTTPKDLEPITGDGKLSIADATSEFKELLGILFSAKEEPSVADLLRTTEQLIKDPKMYGVFKAYLPVQANRARKEAIKARAAAPGTATAATPSPLPPAPAAAAAAAPAPAVATADSSK